MRAWQAEMARRAAEAEGTCEQRHRGAEGEGQLGVGEGIRVAATPDAGEELSGKSPSGRGPLLLSGASSGAGFPLHPHPCPAWGWPERQPGFRCEKKATPAPFMRQPGGAGRGEEGGTQSPPNRMTFLLCPADPPIPEALIL